MLHFNESLKGNIYEYLEINELPIGFNKNIDKNHISDIVRLAVLKKYGGVYIDTSVTLLKSIEEICYNDMIKDK